MFMTGKFDIFMSRAFIHRIEHIAAPERRHFLGRRKASVVAKYTADKAGTQKHVGALQQYYVRPGFPGG
jgi:hypothetical protein